MKKASEQANRQQAKPRAVIYRCDRCKAARRVEHPTTYHSEPTYFAGRRGEPHRVRRYLVNGRQSGKPAGMLCPNGCERYGQRLWMLGKPIKGTVTDHACNAKCEAATGPNCECSCGGANHGKAHSG